MENLHAVHTFHGNFEPLDYFYIFGPEGAARHLARLQLDASF